MRYGDVFSNTPTLNNVKNVSKTRELSPISRRIVMHEIGSSPEESIDSVSIIDEHKLNIPSNEIPWYRCHHSQQINKLME
jgi:hypothetical protein